MTLVEPSLLRVVARIGIDRLATDPTLARVALKDVFPEDALVVSLLTAAVEHGALAALRDQDGEVPLAVLGPRLANQLRRDTGISPESSRWAVGAWAAALGMLPRPLPDLPRDGIDFAVADVFTATAPARATPAAATTAPEATAAAAATDDVPTLVRPVVIEPSTRTEAAPPVISAVPALRQAPTTAAEAGAADDDLDDDRTVQRPTTGPGEGAPAVEVVPAVDAAPASAPAITTQEPAAPPPAAPVEAPASALEAPSAPEAPAAPAAPTTPTREAPPAAEAAGSAEALTRVVSPAGEAVAPVRADVPTDLVPPPAVTPDSAPPLEPDEEPTMLAPTRAPTPTPLEPDDAPTVLTPAPPRAAPPPISGTPDDSGQPPRRPRRRRRLLVLAGAVVLLLLVVGITAIVLRPSAALAATGDADHASWTSGGRSTAIAAGSAIPAGTDVAVRSGWLELHAGGSVLRLASGAHARVNGPADVTLLSGRAFVLADGTPLTLRSTAGSARVAHGRLLAGCATTCTVTALDTGTVLTKGTAATTLHALEQAGSGSPTTVLADAVRADPWFVSNDSGDRRQGRTPLGVTGVSVTGSWMVSMTRSDLPFALSRELTLSPDCTSTGCTVQATTRMSDGQPQPQLTGTVRPLDAAGSRLAIDYGSHTVRCHWVVGTKRGEGVDGRETVSDELDFVGTGTARSVTGRRTSTYTPTAAGCTTSAYTATKTTALTGSRATAAQLTLPALSAQWDQQQAKLNYLLDGGTGCSVVATAPQADLQSDQRCSYASGAISSLELAVYNTSGGIRAAYTAATKGLVPPDTGDCSIGPCEGVAPNGHGRYLLTTDSAGAVLITYDPRAANLLVTVHGATMRGLASWWAAQQKAPSVYRAFPISRVGV